MPFLAAALPAIAGLLESALGPTLTAGSQALGGIGSALGGGAAAVNLPNMTGENPDMSMAAPGGGIATMDTGGGPGGGILSHLPSGAQLNQGLHTAGDIANQINPITQLLATLSGGGGQQAGGIQPMSAPPPMPIPSAYPQAGSVLDLLRSYQLQG